MSTKTLNPAGAGDILQPLREVGTVEKTDFWDIDDVMEALRFANRLGIPVKPLFRTRRTDATGRTAAGA